MIRLSPNDRTAYVSIDESGKVAMVSLSDWKVEKMIDAGKVLTVWPGPQHTK